jgi:hypothetical protein
MPRLIFLVEGCMGTTVGLEDSENRKVPSTTRIQTPVRPSRSVVTVLTDLSLLPIIKTGFGQIHYRFQ